MITMEGPAGGNTFITLSDTREQDRIPRSVHRIKDVRHERIRDGKQLTGKQCVWFFFFPQYSSYKFIAPNTAVNFRIRHKKI